MSSSARLQVLLASLCFGTTGTAQALGPDGLSPAGVGAGRILVGGGLLVLVALLTSGGLTKLPKGPLLLAAGAIEWAVERRAPSRAWAGATALACAGVAMLALAGADADISLPGVGLALCAGASYAGYTLAAKRMLHTHSPETVMAGAFGLGAVLLAPVLALAGGGLATPGGAGLIVFLGVVPTAVAYLLFARGLKHLSAAETATLTLAEPLTAALLGVIVLAERLSAPALLGATLILGGLVVLAGPDVRRRPATVPV
jgi:DME family drug/metabolite transporter